MNEPKTILASGTRIKTDKTLGSTSGIFVREALALRRPDTFGVIQGFVGGHGGDIYWVAQIGDHRPTVYGWHEFELAPAANPCPTCKGGGIDFPTSAEKKLCTACPACEGTGETPAETSWARLLNDNG